MTPLGHNELNWTNWTRNSSLILQWSACVCNAMYVRFDRYFCICTIWVVLYATTLSHCSVHTYSIHNNYVAKLNCSYRNTFIRMIAFIQIIWYPDFIWYPDTFDNSYVDGLMQDCNNSIANTLELLQSCTKPSIFRKYHTHVPLAAKNAKWSLKYLPC